MFQTEEQLLQNTGGRSCRGWEWSTVVGDTGCYEELEVSVGKVRQEASHQELCHGSDSVAYAGSHGAPWKGLE